MKKFFCDCSCFFLALAVIMVLSSAIEGTLSLLPALGLLFLFALSINILYRVGWGDPIFPHAHSSTHRTPKQPIPVMHTSSHKLGAA